MELKEIQQAAADFQKEITTLNTYDDVQLVMLKKADELKLTWPETREFSKRVHELKLKG